MSSLLKWLQEFGAWLLDLVLWFPLQIWELILNALALVLESIPVPEWLDTEGGLFDTLPAGVVYFVEPMALPEGLTIMVGAYVIRFLIRRLPLVG